MKSPLVQKTADITGAVLSQLCLLHCLLLPLVVGVLPSLSVMEMLGGEVFHALVLLLATPLAFFSLKQGYGRHECSRPGGLALAALAILWAVFCVEEHIEHDLAAAFNVTGGFLLAWAHWQNWSLTRDSDSACVCSEG